MKGCLTGWSWLGSRSSHSTSSEARTQEKKVPGPINYGDKLQEGDAGGLGGLPVVATNDGGHDGRVGGGRLAAECTAASCECGCCAVLAWCLGAVASACGSSHNHT